MKRYKLGEILELQRGYDLSSNQMLKGDIPVVGSNGIIGYHNVSKGKVPCITVGRSGSVGKVHFYKKPVWVHNTALFVKDFKNNVPVFLYYFLQNLKLDVIYGKTSSVVPSLDRKVAYLLDVPFIDDLSEQQRIAKILSTIDAKIELNKKISRELEAMAKELYDYWFVQFDFPNAQGKPYKSSGGKMVWNATLKREIPEGWEVKKLGDIISKLSSGKRPKGGIDKTLKTGIPSLGAECINEHLGEFDFLSTPFIKDSFKDKLSNGKIEKNDILIYKDGAYVGKVTLFRDGFPYQDAYVNEHVFLIHATEEKYEEFLYFTLSSSSYFNIMQNLGKVKAAQPGLNKDDLNSIMLLVPRKDIIINFHNKVESYFRKIFLNANQIGRLIVLRNQLLPLLMNGQVRVSEEKGASVSQKDDTNRFILWKNTHAVAARGEKNDTVLRAMYDAMDDEDK